MTKPVTVSYKHKVKTKARLELELWLEGVPFSPPEVTEAPPWGPKCLAGRAGRTGRWARPAGRPAGR